MRKPLFSVLGTAQRVDGKVRFVPKSLDYLNHKMSKLPMGKELELSVSMAKRSRTSSQLNYYWALMQLLHEYCGHSPEELHDFCVRGKFGTRKIKLGDIEIEVRRSIASHADMDVNDMGELIDFAQRLCQREGVVIPDPKSLGYLTDENGRIVK